MPGVMKEICAAWRSKIDMALEAKKEQFQNIADECQRYYNGPYNFMYGSKESSVRIVEVRSESAGAPSFCMTLNLPAETVQLFGPALYHRNPNRMVSPRKAPDIPDSAFGQFAMTPQYQMLNAFEQQMRATDVGRAAVYEAYLNFTPSALDLKTQMRYAVDEAIIKGCSTLWAETYTPPGSNVTMVGNWYDTVDNLVMDPDAETMEECTWYARRCVHPVWEVEQMYGLPRGTLKGNRESTSRTAETVANTNGAYKRRQGMTNDLIVYWKVYSKMGMGNLLDGAPKEMDADLKKLGQYCYLVVCNECDYPLNLPPRLQELGPAVARDFVRWPTPFWADGGMPFTPIYFHTASRQVWPKSHIGFALGELQFLNWAYSFVASKIKNSCRDFLVVPKSLEEEWKQQLMSGRDLAMLQIPPEMLETFAQHVKFLQHPAMNGDIIRVMEMVQRAYQDRTGTTELMYGNSPASHRSATETQVKADQMHLRPDDMANKLEDQMSAAARKEAMVMRRHLGTSDMLPVLGPKGAWLWEHAVLKSPPEKSIHELEFRIEAGSSRKPNRERNAANAGEAVKTFFQPLFDYGMQTGDMNPINSVIGMWAKANDVPPEGMMLLGPPPMQPAPGAPPGAPPQSAPPPEEQPAPAAA